MSDYEDRIEPAEPRYPEQVSDAIDNLVAIMSGVTRKGYWQPASQVNVYAVMGVAMLDFREAAMLEGTTVIDVYALMGGAKLVFPPDVGVECHGNGLMGGFSHVSHYPDPETDAHVVVRGFALMGGVEIVIKEPFASLDDDDED